MFDSRLSPDLKGLAAWKGKQEQHRHVMGKQVEQLNEDLNAVDDHHS